MDVCHRGFRGSEEEMEIRKGPWTMEEDAMLMDYVSIHGEGRWNSVARSSGLKRTGKSCRLRWLNYLRPDVRRGNITLPEQLLILELHSRWGNRWSKIAQQLPGRTDNEIKNYWRTRVQKQAKQLKCDVNSKQFRDAMRYVWMPRLLERIQAEVDSSSSTQGQPTTAATNPTIATATYPSQVVNQRNEPSAGLNRIDPNITSEISATSSDSLDSTQLSTVSDLTDSYNLQGGRGNYPDSFQNWCPENLGAAMDFQGMEQPNNAWMDGGDSMEGMWNDVNMWLLQQHLSDDV